MSSSKKLVLFDIDGTLIYHAGTPDETLGRYRHAIKLAFGIDHPLDIVNWKYDGWVERGIAWDVVKDYKVSQEDFMKNLPVYATAMADFVVDQGKRKQLYYAIEPAKKLVQILYDSQTVDMGILTGNVEKIAWLKLRYAGLATYFKFGLYGEEADDRNALAHLVQKRAHEYFNTVYTPQDIVVIGDTKYDIRCGKSIGAITIVVTTGDHEVVQALAQEEPDFLVDSLMDPKILQFFQLQP